MSVKVCSSDTLWDNPRRGVHWNFALGMPYSAAATPGSHARRYWEKTRERWIQRSIIQFWLLLLVATVYRRFQFATVVPNLYLYYRYRIRRLKLSIEEIGRCFMQGCGVRVSLSVEGDSDFGSYLFHLDLCVIMLNSVWLLCNLLYN